MKKYLTIIMSVVILASCSNFLDTYPADQMSSESMWTTESLADQGMAGLYKIFVDTNEATSSIYCLEGYQDGFDRQIFMGLEFQTQLCASSFANYSMYQLGNATKTATTFDVKYEWQWAYTGIHRVNDALENLYKAGLSEEKYERYICEAKFLRAFFYSRLNMIYQGVPIYLETIQESECIKGQSTAEEVWDVVISDLTDCLTCDNFPDNTLANNYGRPSKGAAYSLRGMAYMWMAWLKGEDNSYYQLAANDFEKVSECGYGLWAGNYIDFFHYNNDRDHEMIFPIQYSADTGFADYLQMLVAPRDMYQGWSPMRPSFDFVTYFQNADGSDFDWAERIPEWNDDVFVNNRDLREVFFLRDSIEVDSGRNVLSTVNGVAVWDSDQVGLLQERVNVLGDVFDKYYLEFGNVDRLKSCYNNRDPRLKDIVIVPYEPYTVYYVEYNNGEECVGKEIRWPYVRTSLNGDYQDIYHGNSQASTYLYSKYNYKRKGELEDRLHCPTDWPLIRYTDIYLHLAECYVHLGRLGDAASIVNEIRSRAGMPSISVGSSDEVMEAVRYERRVELCLEGHDYFDEWRWGTYKDTKFQGKDVYGSQSLWGTYENYVMTWYYTDNMWPWGAPSEECQRNPNLTQKAGWAY